MERSLTKKYGEPSYTPESYFLDSTACDYTASIDSNLENEEGSKSSKWFFESGIPEWDNCIMLGLYDGYITLTYIDGLTIKLYEEEEREKEEEELEDL